MRIKSGKELEKMLGKKRAGEVMKQQTIFGGSDGATHKQKPARAPESGIEVCAPKVKKIGSRQKKVSDEVLATEYAKHQSVWKTASAVGMCGQSVHERLVKMGLSNPVNIFTDEEKEMLRNNYEEAANMGRLDELASIMNRTKHFICRQAKALGLTNASRKKPYFGGIDCALLAWKKANEHPRGMLGKKHSNETKEVMSKISKERWDTMTEDERDEFIVTQLRARLEKHGTLAHQKSSSTRSWKADWRDIGSTRSFYRSSWEANYARYLEMLRLEGRIESWEHEPKTFWFEGVRRGCVSYLPDFRVIAVDQTVTYHEVKGWMDDRSKTKIARMAKYYPDIALVVIDSDEYKKLKNIWRWIIDGWED